MMLDRFFDRILCLLGLHDRQNSSAVPGAWFCVRPGCRARKAS